MSQELRSSGESRVTAGNSVPQGVGGDTQPLLVLPAVAPEDDGIERGKSVDGSESESGEQRMPTNTAIDPTPDQTGGHRGTAGRTFPVSADSPFADGYDIASERDALADLVTAENPDESDPRWSRFRLLREREDELRRIKAKDTPRHTAESIALNPAPRRDPEIGQLIDEAPDTMTLHTKEAYRAFRGRPPQADGRGGYIPGGRRFAAVLKAIWYLSGNDNPYADWLLIMMHDRLSALRSKIENASAEKQRLMDRVKAQGLSFSVLKSSKPKTVELGFRSPYGYATASVIVAFDYHVRMVKTLIRKDRMSDHEGAKAIRALGHELVGLFLAPVKWERFLRAQEMFALCRADFLPTATDEGKKRVKAAAARFGEVPHPILTCAHVPRHTRRWVKLSQSELRAIDQALLAVDNSTDADESPLL